MCKVDRHFEVFRNAFMTGELLTIVERHRCAQRTLPRNVLSGVGPRQLIESYKAVVEKWNVLYLPFALTAKLNTSTYLPFVVSLSTLGLPCSPIVGLKSDLQRVQPTGRDDLQQDLSGERHLCGSGQ